MGNIRTPRHGSMQFWPRVRAQRIYARVRTWPQHSVAMPLGFAGYKVGMTHLIVTDNRKTSKTKGEDIVLPVTVLECPPLKLFSVRLYKQSPGGLHLVKEMLSSLDKEVGRTIPLPKKPVASLDAIQPSEFDLLRLAVYTQPKLIGFKKRPEIFELACGGKKEEQLAYAKTHWGKEISIQDVFKEGQMVDVHAVTKGKGFQGPVKRFGVTLRSHKSEKTKRGPGSLGAWRGQGHMMYRVAHAGQMGFHLRTEYNKWLVKVSPKPDDINQKGGFMHYGIIKNPYVLIKGSLPGSCKRLIRFTYPIRSTPSQEAPHIVAVYKG